MPTTTDIPTVLEQPSPGYPTSSLTPDLAYHCGTSIALERSIDHQFRVVKGHVALRQYALIGSHRYRGLLWVAEAVSTAALISERMCMLEHLDFIQR
ncbi:hypothetical protein Tco_0199376 [Tanacetum coccineum]